MFAPRSLIQQAGVENAVDELPVLGDTLAQYAFTLKSKFLEDPHGCWIPFEHRSLEPHEARIRHQVVEHCVPGRRRKSAAPMRLAEPVPKMRGAREDARARPRADAADRESVAFDRKNQVSSRIAGDPQPRLRIFLGIRMRKN